jgi:hypothetical protein
MMVVLYEVVGVKHQFQHSVIYYITQREAQVTDKLYHVKSYPKNCENDTGDKIYLKRYKAPVYFNRSSIMKTNNPITDNRKYMYNELKLTIYILSLTTDNIYILSLLTIFVSSK